MDTYFQMTLDQIVELLYQDPKRFKELKDQMYFYQQANASKHSEEYFNNVQVFNTAYEFYQLLYLGRSVSSDIKPEYRDLWSMIRVRFTNSN